MAYKNAWLAFSATGVAEYVDRRDNPDTYSGPITDDHFALLDSMADGEVVRGMYLKPTINTHVMTLFSVYQENTAGMAAVIQDMVTNWSNHIIVLGAWIADGDRNGLQLGTNWTDETRTAVTGTPTYPIHVDAWKFIPDALSNADLRDINVLQGQKPRIWT